MIRVTVHFKSLFREKYFLMEDLTLFPTALSFSQLQGGGFFAHTQKAQLGQSD